MSPEYHPSCFPPVPSQIRSCAASRLIRRVDCECDRIFRPSLTVFLYAAEDYCAFSRNEIRSQPLGNSEQNYTTTVVLCTRIPCGQEYARHPQSDKRTASLAHRKDSHADQTRIGPIGPSLWGLASIVPTCRRSFVYPSVISPDDEAYWTRVRSNSSGNPVPPISLPSFAASVRNRVLRRIFWYSGECAAQSVLPECRTVYISCRC